jgi:hypothetical protein
MSLYLLWIFWNVVALWRILDRLHGQMSLRHTTFQTMSLQTRFIPAPQPPRALPPRTRFQVLPSYPASHSRAGGLFWVSHHGGLVGDSCVNSLKNYYFASCDVTRIARMFHVHCPLEQSRTRGESRQGDRGSILRRSPSRKDVDDD